MRARWLLLVLASCGARTSLSDPSAAEPDPECGNGIVEGGEDCDDGNEVDADACRNACVRAKCGDGIVDPGEACDDGNLSDTDACTSACRPSTCGNGIVDAGEECESDDANVCTPNCTIPRCGDGFIAPATEVCDAGPANEDRPALAIIVDGVERPTRPYSQNTPAFAFYAYDSASSHTNFEEAHASKLFAFQSPFDPWLGIFTLHNIDEDSSGIETGNGRVQQFFEGVPSGGTVVIADDNGDELFQSGDVIEGDWRFQNNTDGGVIGGLPFPGDWSIEVSSTFEAGIDKWTWLDPSMNTDLPSDPMIIVARSTPSTCRTTCVPPQCGDNFLDAGEVCDDGNVIGGDGCSADCTGVEF